MKDSPHRIYPHGDLFSIGPSIWQVQGRLALPVPRNMTVLRASDGRLILYSVVAMQEAGMSALEALGEPSFLIIPHRRHQMDAPFYKARYPRLRVLAPNPAHVRHLAVDGRLEELAPLGVRARVVPGNTYDDVALDAPRGHGNERVLCVCETLSNIDATGLLRLFKLFGPPGGGFGVARAVKLREIRDRDALRIWLSEQAARNDVTALLFGHGAPITLGVPSMLQRAARQV